VTSGVGAGDGAERASAASGNGAGHDRERKSTRPDGRGALPASEERRAAGDTAKETIERGSSL
jgi:hypothetical protein